MTRSTTQARYIAVLKEFKTLVNKRANGKQLYSLEYIISELSRKHFYSEFMITRIITNQSNLLSDSVSQPAPVQTQLSI